MPTMDSQRLVESVSGMTGSARIRRILILGGTSEARRLAEALADRSDLEVTVSLAGRTKSVPPLPVPVRVGSFGGAAGLAEYLRAEQIDVLIDATHPHAAAISANAAEATKATGVTLLALRRPPWAKAPGDNWIEIETMEDAVAALGAEPKRVFLALGRNNLAPFASAPQHFYLVRSVDPVDPPLAVPHATYITARGPFSEGEDRTLLTQHRIDIVVAKNSGGAAAYGKIAAARSLGLPVVMLTRPALPDVPSVETVEEVLAWLDHAGTLATARGV
jgi:precorrin-6A/cobalt-precorrin-6A reductase